MKSILREGASTLCTLVVLGAALAYANPLVGYVGVRAYAIGMVLLGGATAFCMRCSASSQRQLALEIARHVDRIMIGGAETSFFLDSLKKKIASDVQVGERISDSADSIAASTEGIAVKADRASKVAPRLRAASRKFAAPGKTPSRHPPIWHRYSNVLP